MSKVILDSIKDGEERVFEGQDVEILGDVGSSKITVFSGKLTIFGNVKNGTVLSSVKESIVTSPDNQIMDESLMIAFAVHAMAIESGIKIKGSVSDNVSLISTGDINLEGNSGERLHVTTDRTFVSKGKVDRFSDIEARIGVAVSELGMGCRVKSEGNVQIGILGLASNIEAKTFKANKVHDGSHITAGKSIYVLLGSATAEYEAPKLKIKKEFSDIDGGIEARAARKRSQMATTKY